MPIGQADRLMPTLRRVVLARQSAARSDGDLLGAFVLARDAEAFAELVRRHGPMVLGVCRRVVGDRTAADDAFQAAFLVLARRAASVRPRERVGNWLYGVAYRTALKARTVLARRRSREKQVDVMPESIAPPPVPAWTDLQLVIDEELARLPDKLRLPVVLCDLEGRPQREVAKHLNVAPATLATRLASARRTLAQRLTRRGVTLSGGALAGLLGIHASASAVPAALAAGVVRAVEAGASGAAANSLVSANALQLSEGVMRMMMLAKLKAVAVLAVTALVLTTGLGLGLVPAAAGDEPGPGAPAQAKVGGIATGSAARPVARPKDAAPPDQKADDVTFLRRLCLDVRGTLPTDVETWFFVSDADDGKRAKVVGWMARDDAAKAALAKKLGVPLEHVKVVRARLSADKQYVELSIDATGVRFVKPLMLAFSGDGANLVASGPAEANRGSATAPTGLGIWTSVGYDQKLAPSRVVVTGENDVATAKIVTTEFPYPLADLRGTITFSAATGKLLATSTAQRPQLSEVDSKDGKADLLVVNEVYAAFADATTDSDAEFLKRVLTDVRGSGPTALETKYFTEDKDSKKREKLIDTLLKEPAVQKKLGDAWKAKMLEPKAVTIKSVREFKNDQLLIWLEADGKSQPAAPKPPAPQPDKYEKLVGALIAAKKSDEAILEAVTLAVLSRLPTDSEKKLVLASIATTSDRKAAWLAVARSLAGAEAKSVQVEVKPAQMGLRWVVEPTSPAPPKPPASPAKP